MAKEMTVEMLDLRRAFEAVLECIPEKALAAFVAKKKLIAGGMRPGNAVFMRKLLLNRYGSTLKAYELDLAILLRTHVPEVRFLAMLAPEAVQQYRLKFMVFFGKARFLLALLQDAREAIRGQAAQWMEEAGADLPEIEAAQKALERAFSPIGAIGQGDSPAGNALLREALTAAEQQVDALKKEVKHTHRVAEEAKVQLLREQKTLLETKDFAITAYKQRVEQLEYALRREEELRDLRVKELLLLRQCELFRGWLKPMCKVDALLEEAKHKPLLERAEALLEAQRKIDRAAAERHRAEDELKAVEQALQAVEQTLATAQVVLPELRDLHKELCTQRDHCRRMLEPEEILFSAVAKELAVRIEACSEEDYCAVRDWLNLSARIGALSTEEAKTLRSRFHRKMTLLSAANPELKPEDIAMDPETEGAAIQRRNPALSAAMTAQAPLLLFLDGHNMINGIGRYRPRRGRAQTHEDARNRLETEMRRMFCNLPCVAVHLVWDGEEKTQHNQSENVLVHYSGGTGEHRADRYILSQIDFYKERTEMPMVLVTDDNGFAGEARKRGVQVCKLHDFEAFLGVPLA